MIIKCPKCNTNFEEIGKWGKKKFCSRACANSRIQTKEMRESKSKKLSQAGDCQYCGFKTLSKNGLVQHERVCLQNPNASRLINVHLGQNTSTRVRVPLSIVDMSKRTISKVLKRLKASCSNCGWGEASCDLHHIVPKSKGGDDTDDNLTVLCPNCHRLAHNNKLTIFKSVSVVYGPAWREHYYSHE